MLNNSYEDFQYDSCISRGICSINPRNSALQTILVLYLRLFAKFLLKIVEKTEIDAELKAFVLNISAVSIFNMEFNDKSYLNVIKQLKEKLLEVVDEFLKYYPDENIEKDKALKFFNETSDILSAIKYGEKYLKSRLEASDYKIRDLYNIILVIIKSLSINSMELESYGIDCEEGFITVLKLFEKINIKESHIENLRDEIIKASKLSDEILKKIREKQEKIYGEQIASEVSFSTVPNKAVLVVGSSIRELENVIDHLKDYDIDIYTHDDMMLAHTFPKFKEYSRLKGQFGLGIENCLLDFATFPGPIVLTKHSLHNIENLYRGRLFTTDCTYPKGVVKIIDDDYTELIKSVKTSRGFKTGKQCESIFVGYSFPEIKERISFKINSGNYKKIFIIGLDSYSLEQKAYFEKLVRLVSGDVLIISFSYAFEKDNFIHINACFDAYAINRVYDFVKGFEIPITIFIPKCDKNSLAQMVDFSQSGANVFVGKCKPIILNPSLMKTLEEEFSINQMTIVKKDLEKIDDV